MRKPTTPIRVDRELNRRLHAAAADRDVSVAWLANRLIAEGLDNLTGGEVVLTQARDVDDAARLRELCGFLIDACAAHGIPVPLNSSLLDLAADIASDGGATAVRSVDPEADDPLDGIPLRPETKARVGSLTWPTAQGVSR